MELQEAVSPGFLPLPTPQGSKFLPHLQPLYLIFNAYLLIFISLKGRVFLQKAESPKAKERGKLPCEAAGPTHWATPVASWLYHPQAEELGLKPALCTGRRRPKCWPNLCCHTPVSPLFLFACFLKIFIISERSSGLDGFTAKSTKPTRV